MSFEHLPKLMNDAVKSLSVLNNTPLPMAIQVVLGVANLAVQSHYNIDTKYYGVGAISLFLLNMSPTGATKTTNFRETTKGIERFMEEERIRLKDEKQRYLLEKKVYDKKEDKYVKDQLNVGAIIPQTPAQKKIAVTKFTEALRGVKPSIVTASSLSDDAPKMPKPIQTAKLIISKGTVNGIIEQFKSQSSIGLFSGEAGEFFNSHSFQGGNDNSKSIEMAAALTSWWDGSPTEKLTGIEQTTLYNRRLALCLLLQETTIRKFMSNPVYADQGFVHRMLITQCGQFDTPDFDCSDENIRRISVQRAKLEPFHQRIYELVSKPVTIKEGSDFELVLETLNCTHEALVALDAFGNEAKRRKYTDMKDWAPFAGRAHEHAMRIAATLAAFEKQSEVTLENALGAIELMNFYFEQRKGIEIEAQSKNSEQLDVALKLVAQIKTTSFDGTLRDFRNVARYGFKKFDEDQRTKTIKEMVATGDVELYECVASNGRTTTNIRAVA